MPIQYYCANCSKPIEVDDSFANQSATCPYCGSVTMVPPASTYRQGAPARPVDGRVFQTEGGPGLPPEPWAGGVRYAAPPPFNRAGVRLGWWSLGLSVTAVVIYLVGVIGAIAVLMAALGPATQPSLEQLEQLQAKIMKEHPWVIVCQLSGMLLAGVGLTLGIVGLVQQRRQNTPAVVGVVLSSVFYFCFCISVAVLMFQ